jgi:multidrug efflux pump subunit AcrA (membrane-fusion protein)
VKTLFRPEALDGQRQSWLGSVLLIRPLSLTLLTWSTVGVAVLVVGYLFIGEYSRKAHLHGVLVADRSAIRVMAPPFSTVLEVHAGDEQVVRRGDVLFVLSPTGTSAGGPTLPTLAVRAPQDGMLSEVTAAPGQRVSHAVALANLTPVEAVLRAQLFAPASAIGFLHPDQRVLLRYQALPYQTFGHHQGQVLQVSRTPMPAGAESDIGSPLSAEPWYRITVSLDPQSVPGQGKALPLEAGMRLEADVSIDQRRLIDWLFEPVSGSAGRA